MPLTNHDLKKIQSSFTVAFDELWKGHLEPAMNGIMNEMATKQDLEGMATKQDLEKLQINLKKDNQDTRDYVDKGIEKLRGDLVSYDKTIIKKVDTLTEVLAKNQVITQSEKSEVVRISPFPATQAVAE